MRTNHLADDDEPSPPAPPSFLLPPPKRGRWAQPAGAGAVVHDPRGSPSVDLGPAAGSMQPPPARHAELVVAADGTVAGEAAVQVSVTALGRAFMLHLCRVYVVSDWNSMVVHACLLLLLLCQDGAATLCPVEAPVEAPAALLLPLGSTA